MRRPSGWRWATARGTWRSARPRGLNVARNAAIEAASADAAVLPRRRRRRLARLAGRAAGGRGGEPGARRVRRPDPRPAGGHEPARVRPRAGAGDDARPRPGGPRRRARLGREPRPAARRRSTARGRSTRRARARATRRSGSGGCAPRAGGSATSPRPASTTGARARTRGSPGCRAPPTTAGVHARRFDAAKGTAPGLGGELRTLAGCVWHIARRRCGNGIVMAAHSAGRIRAAVARGDAARGGGGAATAPALAGGPDYLSGRVGELGRRALRGRAHAGRGRGRAGRAAAARGARGGADGAAARRVLVAGVARPEVGGRGDRARAGALAPRRRAPPRPARAGPRQVGEPARHARAPSAGRRRLAADRRRRRRAAARASSTPSCSSPSAPGSSSPSPRTPSPSHAAWPVTRRRPGALARRTRFVEIGPVTALHRDAFPILLPFPDLQMGWGLDAHWSAAAAAAGSPSGSSTRPRSATCARSPRPIRAPPPSRRRRRYLENRPYVTRDQAARDARDDARAYEGRDRRRVLPAGGRPRPRRLGAPPGARRARRRRGRPRARPPPPRPEPRGAQEPRSAAAAREPPPAPPRAARRHHRRLRALPRPAAPAQLRLVEPLGRPARSSGRCAGSTST